jgi:hypothetical protein
MTDIVQSTEHSIQETFVRKGEGHNLQGELHSDKKGILDIRIKSPTADVFHILLADDIIGCREGFDISVEGAAALAYSLRTMLKWRATFVMAEKNAAKTKDI